MVFDRHQCGATATTKGCAAVFVTASLALLLTACAAPSARRGNDNTIREFAARGYASVEHDAVVTSLHNWDVGGHAVRLALSRPERSGTCAVVIYLPGLGETSDAGERWRSAWAAAGYAVVAVQALAEDAGAFSSALAREGDFKALGRLHFGGAAMARRGDLITALVAEARRRSASSEPEWQHLDWSRVALAGYDLGAYTAMALAGEHVRDADRVAIGAGLRAVVAFSPYATYSEGADASRYRDIHAAVMSVTGDADADALGLIAAPALRSAPFEQLPGAGHYLLSINGLPHAAFSGSAAALRADPAEGSSASGGGSPSRSDENGKHGHGGRRKGAGEGGSASGSGGAKPERGRSDGGGGGGEKTQSVGSRQMGLIAAQDVSTAFLDAQLKDDPLAREWLRVDAARWLGTTAALRQH
jgi:dienelactone hydrolase